MEDHQDRRGPGDPDAPRAGGSSREAALERLHREHAGTPRDVGRTSGGGSLGHKQPPDVTSESPIRNQPPD